MWRHTIVVPELGRWGREDLKLKVILSYTVSLKPEWTTQDPESLKRGGRETESQGFQNPWWDDSILMYVLIHPIGGIPSHHSHSRGPPAQPSKCILRTPCYSAFLLDRTTWESTHPRSAVSPSRLIDCQEELPLRSERGLMRHVKTYLCLSL